MSAKTPDEIKKGLETCSADECHGQHTDCPYHPDLMCIRNICADAFALIQQLEERNKSLQENNDKLLALDGELHRDYLEQRERADRLEAELDAAVKDVKRYAACCRCKNLAKYGGKCFGGLRCEVKGDAREFEWRGVQKEE